MLSLCANGDDVQSPTLSGSGHRANIAKGPSPEGAFSVDQIVADVQAKIANQKAMPGTAAPRRRTATLISRISRLAIVLYVAAPQMN
jgi:hypothetical protein